MKKLNHKTVAAIYGVAGLIILPWTLRLADELPKRHIIDDWHTVWIGFDIILALVFIANAYGLWRQRYWVPLTSTALGVMVLCDVWFDVGTARTGTQLRESVMLAFFIELPVAFYSLYISHQALKHRIK